MSLRGGKAAAFVAGLVFAVPACSLDDREISRLNENLGEAGVSSLPVEDAGTGRRGPSKPPPPHGQSEGGSSSPRRGGDAGSSSPIETRDAGEDAGTCPDDNRDGKPDCKESLVVNWHLEHDASRFTADPGATIAWRADDASGQKGSGSLAVTNTSHDDSTGWAFTGAGQCVPVQPGTSYTVQIEAFIPEDQKVGGANIGLQFFTDPSCAGSPSSKYDAPPTDKVGSWTSVGGSAVAPPHARSALVHLVVLKPLADPPFTAWFDDVQVVVSPPVR